MNINFKQGGVSLVSLMVGMTISLMTLAAASMLFQQTYRVSKGLSDESISDGTLSTIINELQINTLIAGFGMSDSVTPHFETAVDGDGLSRAYWRYNLKDPDVVICKGFEEQLEVGQLVLQWVTSTSADCATAALETLTWDDDGFSTTIESRDNSILLFEEDDTGDCWPYTDGEREERMVFKVTTKVTPGSDIEYTNSFCLVNIGSN